MYNANLGAGGVLFVGPAELRSGKALAFNAGAEAGGT